MIDRVGGLACFLGVDLIAARFQSLVTRARLNRYRKQGVDIHFVPQGGYFIEIAGDLSKFSIAPGSHLKSDTFIECSGGVTIGKFFHPARGLTIFSSNHNYRGGRKIPYDETDIVAPVVIGDFVWCGTNVTIVPGVTVGDGAIIGAGSVVVRNVEPLTIVGGAPAEIIGTRDAEHFQRLLLEKSFY